MSENNLAGSEYRAFIKKYLDSLKSLENPKEVYFKCKSFLDEHYEKMSNIERARTYTEIARAKYHMGDYKDVRGYVETGIRIIDMCDFKSEDSAKAFSTKSFLLNIIGLSYLREGEIFKAISFFSKSYENAIAGDDPLVDIFILNNLGNSYLMISDYERAAEIFEIAIDVLGEKTSYSYMPSFSLISRIIYLNAAAAYSGMNRFDTTEQFYRKIKSNISDSELAIISPFISNLESYLYEVKGDYKKSDEIIEHIEDLVKKGSGQAALEIVTMYLGRLVKREKKSFDLFFRIRNRLDEILKKDNNVIIQIQISFMKLLLILKEDKKELFKAAFQEYLDLSEKYYKFLSIEQGKAISEQYNNISLRKEREIASEAKKVAIYKRIEIQKEREKYRLDYDTFKFINGAINQVKKSNIFVERMEIFSKEIKRVIKFTEYQVYIISESGEKFVIYDMNSKKDKKTLEVPILETNKHILEVVKTKKIIMPDKNTIIIPLVFNGSAIGVLSIGLDNSFDFKEEHFKLLTTLSGYISMVIRDHILRRKLRKETNKNIELRKKTLFFNEKVFQSKEDSQERRILSKEDYESRILFFIRKSIREKKPLGIMAIEIDDFKKYISTYGEKSAEDVVRQISHSLSDSFEASKTLFSNYGTEEFFIATILDDFLLADAEVARVMSVLKRMNIGNINSKEGRVTVSVGCAVYIPGEVSELSVFEKAAENLLAMAINKGGNRAEIRLFNTLKNRKSENNDRK